MRESSAPPSPKDLGHPAGLVENGIVAGNGGSGFYSSQKNVLSCTITGNRSYGFPSHIGTIHHAILWDNVLGPRFASPTPLFSGTANPFFVTPGHWNPTNTVWVDGDYHLTPDSPYIDAGDPAYGTYPSNPTQDIDGNPRIVGARVDIGAYEFQGACDGPDFDGDGTPDLCDRDIDGDGIPNVVDRCDDTPLGIPVDSEGRPPADLNHDCTVDLCNFRIFQESIMTPDPIRPPPPVSVFCLPCLCFRRSVPRSKLGNRKSTILLDLPRPRP